MDYQTAEFLGLIFTVVSVILCPIIASYKGRSVVGWFFGGLFLGLIGLIIVACLSNLNNIDNSVNSYSRQSALSSSNNLLLTPQQKSQKAAIFKSLLEKGTISQTEYELKMQSIGMVAKNSDTNSNPSDSEVINLLEKYKKLLDDGVITQEDFNTKKAELLNKK